MPDAGKALGISLLVLIALLIFTKLVPVLYFLVKPLFPLWLLAAVYVKGKATPGFLRQRTAIILSVICLLLFVMFVSISITSINMYRDYTQNVAPWCINKGLEPYFMPSEGDSTYPLYGCKKTDARGTTLYLVEYPFDGAKEEARLGIS